MLETEFVQIVQMTENLLSDRLVSFAHQVVKSVQEI